MLNAQIRGRFVSSHKPVVIRMERFIMLQIVLLLYVPSSLSSAVHAVPRIAQV